jgi:hypothetical protein
MRRSSLFDTNQRFFRIALILPLLVTFLRNRPSNRCCDSLVRNTTLVNFDLLYEWFLKLKISHMLDAGITGFGNSQYRLRKNGNQKLNQKISGGCVA